MRQFILSIFILIAVSMALVCPAANAADAAPLTFEDIQAMNGGNAVISLRESGYAAFIGGNFYDGPVRNADDAFAALGGILPLLCDGPSASLILQKILKSPGGDTYYIFLETNTDKSAAIRYSTVKIGVDRNGRTFLAASSLSPERDDTRVPVISREYAIEFIRAVIQNLSGDFTLLPELTQERLVYNQYNDSDADYLPIYAVFTTGPGGQPYVAFCVLKDRSSLYSRSVSSPDSPALGRNTERHDRFFKSLTSVPYSQTVTLSDGTKEKRSAPVSRDADGDLILGDLKNRILVVDYADYRFDDEFSLISQVDGRFPDEVYTLYTSFRKVYDFFKKLGFDGPDGEGSDILLLYGSCDEDGYPVSDSYYADYADDWQQFAFSAVDDDGQCLDIIAHEYAHCLIFSSMFYNLCVNDGGAINESLCDIIGNHVELLLGGTDDTTWLLGENGAVQRSMSQPHLYSQPEFVWDLFYVPNALSPSEYNDHGGIHRNCSLLNHIAWRLISETGMSPLESLRFWLDVTCAITCRTDFRELSELLPYLLSHTGHAEHADTLREIIRESGIAGLTSPAEYSPGTCLVTMDVPEIDRLHAGDTVFLFHDHASEDIEDYFTTWLPADSWQLQAVLPQGDYLILCLYKDLDEALVYSGTEWVPSGTAEYPHAMLDQPGVTLSSKGLEALSDGE